MNRDSLLMPGAVLLGSVIIGAGLYFGLSAQAPAPPVQPPATQATTTTAPNAQPEQPLTANAPVAQAPAMPAAPMPLLLGSPEAQKRAAVDAEAAVRAEKKAHWIEQCWKPAVAKEKEPATSRYQLSLSFDPQGKQVGQGVSELRDAPSRPDVAACLSRQPMRMSIPAPGEAVGAVVVLEMP